MGFLDWLTGRAEPEQVSIDNADLSDVDRSQLVWAIAGRGGSECPICEQTIAPGADARAAIRAPIGDGETAAAHAGCFIDKYGEERIIQSDDDYDPTLWG
jgi:hypothetical protein